MKLPFPLLVMLAEGFLVLPPCQHSSWFAGVIYSPFVGMHGGAPCTVSSEMMHPAIIADSFCCLGDVIVTQIQTRHVADSRSGYHYLGL